MDNIRRVSHGGKLESVRQLTVLLLQDETSDILKIRNLRFEFKESIFKVLLKTINITWASFLKGCIEFIQKVYGMYSQKVKMVHSKKKKKKVQI